MSVVYRALVEKLGAASAVTFVGNEGELFWDPTSTALKISDGSTAGGVGISGGSSVTETTTNGENKVGVTTNTSTSFTNGAIEFQTDNGTTSEVRWIIAPQGSLIPKTNAAYDLGSAEYKVRDIYEDQSSDIRLKKDVVNYTGGLNFVESLRVVDFTWKEEVDTKAGKRETGFIAQELGAALEASNYNSWRLHNPNPDSYQGIDPKQLIPALVSAVQELSTEVKELRERLGE
jgi:hypothetical protein